MFLNLQWYKLFQEAPGQLTVATPYKENVRPKVIPAATVTFAKLHLCHGKAAVKGKEPRDVPPPPTLSHSDPQDKAP